MHLHIYKIVQKKKKKIWKTKTQFLCVSMLCGVVGMLMLYHIRNWVYICIYVYKYIYRSSLKRVCIYGRKKISYHQHFKVWKINIVEQMYVKFTNSEYYKYIISIRDAYRYNFNTLHLSRQKNINWSELQLYLQIFLVGVF